MSTPRLPAAMHDSLPTIISHMTQNTVKGISAVMITVIHAIAAKSACTRSGHGDL